MSSLTRKKAWSNSVIQPRMLRCSNCSSVRGCFRRARPVSGTERPRLSLPPGTLTLRDYRAQMMVSVMIHDLSSRAINQEGVAYLLEPLKRIVREVVALSMGEDILGQCRENSLEIGALGSRSHDDKVCGKDFNDLKIENTQLFRNEPLPRGGTVCYVCYVCPVWSCVAVSPGATRGRRGFFKAIERSSLCFKLYEH